MYRAGPLDPGHQAPETGGDLDEFELEMSPAGVLGSDNPAGSTAGRVLILHRDDRAAFEEQARSTRQHGQAFDAIDDEIGAEPFGLDFGNVERPCDFSQFGGGND